MIVGITGCFGSGKSTVTQFFAEADFKTIDADVVCKSFYTAEYPELLKALNRHFGSSISDGKKMVHTAELAEIVFNDAEELKFLTSLLHPLINNFIKSEVNDSRMKNIDLAVEIPLLFEGNYQRLVDKTITVYASDNVRLSHLKQRNFTKFDLEKRENFQMPMAEKLKLSDYAIINNGSLELLREQCKCLIKNLRKI